MANVFCVNYRNGNNTIYKAIVHSLEETLQVLSTWHPYGRVDMSAGIGVSWKTEEEIRILFIFGLDSSFDLPGIRKFFPTFEGKDWKLVFEKAFSENIDEHERLFKEYLPVWKAKRKEQIEYIRSGIR